MSAKKLCLNFLLYLTFTFMSAVATAGSLFESDAPMTIELSADFKTMERAREKTQSYPGTLTIDSISLPIELSLRGNFRLRATTCRYPPLSVDFKKSERKDATAFAKEGDLKLVVQCHAGKRYGDYLRTEFLIYKLLNKITPLSYRVRWVDIAYAESGGDGNSTDLRQGFFVERKKNLAARNDLQAAKNIYRISHQQLDASQAALLEHFEFLVGNTDYSLVSSAEPDDCCHNAKLLEQKLLEQTTDAVNTVYVPVIYDFDSTGLVNASYAQVADSLGIKNVTQRLYRGACRDRTVMHAAREQLLAHQSELLNLILTDPLLSDNKKKRTSRYLSSGFDTLRSDKKYQRSILKKCP